MRITRRDETLDLFLGKEVFVVFYDGSVKEGVLEYQGPVTPEIGYSFAYHYHIGNSFFRKTHVKMIREKGEHKWTLRKR